LFEQLVIKNANIINKIDLIVFIIIIVPFIYFVMRIESNLYSSI
jgi:hypothetical protein